MRDGDVLVGLVEYHRYGDEIAILHTEVGDEFGGRGFGGRAGRGGHGRREGPGQAVLPYCQFTWSWLGKHLEYLDLVPEAYRDRFRLPVSID